MESGAQVNANMLTAARHRTRQAGIGIGGAPRPRTISEKPVSVHLPHQEPILAIGMPSSYTVPTSSARFSGGTPMRGWRTSRAGTAIASILGGASGWRPLSSTSGILAPSRDRPATLSLRDPRQDWRRRDGRRL